MTYSDEILRDVSFIVDDRRSLRIRYSELARVIDRPIESVFDFAGERLDWLGQIAPLHQRREGPFLGAAYYSVGQAVAIAVGLGRSDAEDDILEAFNGFDRKLTEDVDRQVALRQARDEDDAKMERAPTLLRASLEQLRASPEGVALLREVSAKLDGLAGSAPQPAASRGWRFWRRG